MRGLGRMTIGGSGSVSAPKTQKSALRSALSAHRASETERGPDIRLSLDALDLFILSAVHLLDLLPGLPGRRAFEASSG
jgi:hypothetical protein